MVSLRLIRERCRPNVLLVDALSKITPVVADKRGMKLTLGWLVHSAMVDGMTKLTVGINRESGQSWMRFFGPRWYRQPIWWDMVPPEPYCYPVMLQVCLSLGELEDDLPIRGVIPGLRHRKPVNLRLEISELGSFQIAWAKEYALDRRETGTALPEEGHAGDARSDGDAAQPA